MVAPASCGSGREEGRRTFTRRRARLKIGSRRAPRAASAAQHQGPDLLGSRGRSAVLHVAAPGRQVQPGATTIAGLIPPRTFPEGSVPRRGRPDQQDGNQDNGEPDYKTGEHLDPLAAVCEHRSSQRPFPQPDPTYVACLQQAGRELEGRLSQCGECYVGCRNLKNLTKSTPPSLPRQQSPPTPDIRFLPRNRGGEAGCSTPPHHVPVAHAFLPAP